MLEKKIEIAKIQTWTKMSNIQEKKRKQTSIMEYVNKRELKCAECIRHINKLA